MLVSMSRLNDADVMVAFYGPIREYAFVWHGGAYIDVCVKDSYGSLRLNGTYYKYGQECINVWNYDTDTTLIDFGDEEAFRAEIQEWINNRF